MPPLWPGGPWRFEAAVTMTECNEQSVTSQSQFAHIADYFLVLPALLCSCSGYISSVIGLNVSQFQRAVMLLTARSARDAGTG